MAKKNDKGGKSRGGQKAGGGVSKKEQIVSLFVSGITEVEDIAIITSSRPSYVGSTLREAGLETGYFDLYTSTNHPMNVYSKFFADRLGFKDEATARESVEIIDRLHGQFDLAGDRAGQHHALMMALTMYDRARWTGKATEANIFREWLINHLVEAVAKTEDGEAEVAGGELSRSTNG